MEVSTPDSVGGDDRAQPARTAGRRYFDDMIERYTRPELGALWTDEARMEAWRRVEVAACEELPSLLGKGNGPTEAELEAIRAARFTVEAVNERERTTDPDMAAFVDVLA
jgi:adenylosuccinate lyase